MPPVPPVVIFGGGLLLAGVLVYAGYQVYQGITHAQEAERVKEEIQPDGGLPEH